MILSRCLYQYMDSFTEALALGGVHIALGTAGSGGGWGEGNGWWYGGYKVGM